MSKIGTYLTETRAEMRKVNWPTRKQAAAFTALVVAISLVTAFYLGAFDYLFRLIVRTVI